MNLIFFIKIFGFIEAILCHIRLRLRFTMKYFPFRLIEEFALTPLGCVRARLFARSMWKMKWNSHLVLSLIGFSFSRCWNKNAAHTKSYFHFCTHAHTHQQQHAHPPTQRHRNVVSWLCDSTKCQNPVVCLVYHLRCLVNDTHFMQQFKTFKQHRTLQTNLRTILIDSVDRTWHFVH